MNPDALESLRGLQGALIADIGPEVASLFGQDTLRTAQMLVESVVNEMDGTADDLIRDNQALAEILARGATAVREIDGQLAQETAAALAEPADPSLRIGALSARNRRLRGLLERLLIAGEENVGSEAGSEELMAVRSDAYHHLRQVAARGWSFWDVLSFRERMARLRAGGG